MAQAHQQQHSSISSILNKDISNVVLQLGKQYSFKQLTQATEWPAIMSIVGSHQEEVSLHLEVLVRTHKMSQPGKTAVRPHICSTDATLRCDHHYHDHTKYAVLIQADDFLSLLVASSPLSM